MPAPETFESDSYGLSLPQPYPWGYPEGLPRSAANPALAASWIPMEGAGRFIGVLVSSTKAGAQFFQLFDSGTLPANGTVPIASVDIASTSSKGLFYGEMGRWMDRGIVLANSSTMGSLTIGSADCIFDVQYIPQVI